MSQTKSKLSTKSKKKTTKKSTSAAIAKSNEVLTLAEAAAYLRTSPEEVLRLVREQGLPGRKIGEDCRFLKSAIQDWLRNPPSAPTKQEFWQTHFGLLKDDPYLEEMLQNIYQQRGRPEVEV